MQTKHFFIEITQAGKAYALKAGSLTSHNRWYFKKNYISENESDWADFWTVFQKAYKENACKNKADVLTYIHGYCAGTGLHFAKNLHQMNVNYVKNAHSPIALTFTVIWHTSFPLYHYCRQMCETRAKIMAPSFWASILKIDENVKNTAFKGKLHLLCHSMGNYFLENMLTAKPTSRGVLFQESIMAAADVEANFFETHYPTIGSLSHRFLALNNRKDRSLIVSNWLNRNKRFGNRPPQYWDNKYPNVYATDVADVSDVKDMLSLFNQHAHYQASASVMQYLNGIFKGDCVQVNLH